MGECVENNNSSEQMIRKLVDNNIINEEENDRWRALLSNTYDRVLSLHQRNWNGIWFRIVRNYFWSATAGKFDIIIGNPPYLRIMRNNPAAQAMPRVVHGSPNLYFLFA